MDETHEPHVRLTAPGPASSSRGSIHRSGTQSNLKETIHEAQEHLEGRNGDGSARRPAAPPFTRRTSTR